MTLRTGATFSADMVYRYRWWQRWDDDIMAVMFLLLNPSTATEVITDPTVARCVERAKRMGFGGIEVCNLYAFRSTDPKALYKINDPVGPDNQSEIKAAAGGCSKIIVGFGKHGFGVAAANDDMPYFGWDDDAAAENYPTIVVEGLRAASRRYDGELLCLGTNRDGSPKHPLYVSGKTEPVPFTLDD